MSNKQTIQPGVHTISYMGLLDFAYSKGPGLDTAEFNPYLLRFLTEFDVIQIRFVGLWLLSLLEQVSRGTIFPV